MAKYTRDQIKEQLFEGIEGADEQLKCTLDIFGITATKNFNQEHYDKIAWSRDWITGEIAQGRNPAFDESMLQAWQSQSASQEVDVRLSSPEEQQQDSQLQGMPAAISNQGEKLYKKIPQVFAHQSNLLEGNLNQAVMANLNHRIQTSDLDADIERELGKSQGSSGPTFEEMLGIPAAPPSHLLPESSTE